MSTITLNDALRAEYERLYKDAKVQHEATVDRQVYKIAAHLGPYQNVADKVGCPWFVVGIIHSLEAGMSFTRHLHNGDPLIARTVHEPKFRPKAGEPPFTWEESAVDALEGRKTKEWHDWTLPGILFFLEGYNGFGYRQYHPAVKSPYLWSMTSVYIKGKYVADGKFDQQAVSSQVGGAAILKRLEQLSMIKLNASGGEKPKA